MTDRELMQQALDALDSDNPDIQLRAATALRARLAQPEPEPPCKTGSQCVGGKCERCAVQPEREWIGLTDGEKLTIVRETDNPVDALAATEAKLKEKNNAI